MPEPLTKSEIVTALKGISQQLADLHNNDQLVVAQVKVISTLENATSDLDAITDELEELWKVKEEVTE